MKLNSRRIILWLSSLLLCIVGMIVGLIYTQKDSILKSTLDHANKDFRGNIKIEKVDIDILKNFPYISIRFTHFQLFERKEKMSPKIMDIENVYLGIDLWHFLQNDLQIKKVVLENGKIHITQDAHSQFNIVEALRPSDEIYKSPNKTFTIDLKAIHLKNIDIKKENTATHIMVETDVQYAIASFQKTIENIKFHIDGVFTLNTFQNQKPTFIYHKHLELHTDLIYDKAIQILQLRKTTASIEGVVFNLIGQIEVKNDVYVDLRLTGNKPNFDLLIALAPEELIPTLRSYDNKGQIYFDAQIKGKTMNSHTPSIQANFGCKNGYIKNTSVNKAIDQLGFHCTFTNGAERSNASSVFELRDFKARPEAGKFVANLTVKNFESPEIDMKLDSDFDLEFLAKFFKLKDLSNINGQVLLSMNFHDIIDLEHPEKALTKLNQAYFSNLSIRHLNFKANNLEIPIRDLNADASVSGQKLELKNCHFQIGHSDLSVNGIVSNLPAVIHKTGEAIWSELHIQSDKIELNEFTGSKDKSASMEEMLTGTKLDLKFKGKANTFITSKSLPIGQYYITNFTTQLKHYHHKLSGLNGTFYINDRDVLIKRLDGKIDKSDFHFEGKIGHYDLWLSDNKIGETEFDFDLTSQELHFKDVFSYKGVNYVPLEYRNEDLKNLKLHGHIALHYNKNLKSTDFYLTEFTGQLKMHPLLLHGFRGNIHLENNLLKIKEFTGNLGENDFYIRGIYHLEKHSSPHQIQIHSKRLNLNEVLSYSLQVDTPKTNHDAGLNIFAAPFPNLNLSVKIDDFSYNKYRLTSISGRARILENHYVYFDKLKLKAADGLVDISGYFNGSNTKKIYFSPDIKVQRLDLDKLFLKFDNFGQDQLVSDNIHGLFSGKIRGKIRMHTDFTTILEESELQIDVKIDNGRLDNYAPMLALSSYIGDKNLTKVKFDTLENRFTLKNGVLSFPNMTINSSLGYMEVSGSQTLEKEMDYYLRLPLKLVGKAAFNKLFKRSPKEIDSTQEDEIIIKDPLKRSRFVNIRLRGTPDNYKLSLEKNKELKKGVQFQKTEDFLFKDIESEWE